MSSSGSTSLWIALVWQPLHAHFLRALLSVIGIALGVALGLAIHLMNRAATNEMTRAARGLFGSADLVVQSTALGFDEALYPIIARVPGVAVASPVVEVRAQLPGRRDSLTLLGMDMLRAAKLQPLMPGAQRNRDALRFFDADSVILSSVAADALPAKIGDSITVQIGMQPVTFKVSGVIPGDANAGYLDIAAAQWRLERLGKLTRIDLRLAPGADAQTVLNAIERKLPPDVKITTPDKESQQSLNMSRAFRINLTALALVALFTGAFLVYSTQSLAVMRRRREFAVLHALGVTPGQQIISVLATGGLLGFLGSLLGVVLGVLIAKVGLQTFLATLLTTRLTPQLELRSFELLGFTVLGVVVSVAGSLAPGLTASRIPTAQALKAGNIETAAARNHTWSGIILWMAAIPLLLAPPLFELPLLGYAAIALILFGAVLCIPIVTRTLLRWLPAGPNVTYQTAIAQLRGAAQAASQSVASILVSVSLMVAMSIMVTSLRGSFIDSLERSFPADIHIQAGIANSSSYLDVDVVKVLSEVPGITRISPSRVVPVLLDKERPAITLIARSVDPDNPGASMTLESSARYPPPPGLLPIWISVALADRYQLAPDNTLRFYVDGREVIGSVRGIWRDLQSAGALIVDYRQYQRLTGDTHVNSISLWTTRNASLDPVLALVRERIGARVPIDIGLPRDYRARALRIFDAVFAITYLLLAVAVCIGMFGISINASAQVLARRAEFGVLRHLGFTRGQIGAVLGIEGLYLGLLGVAAGLTIGSCISTILIHVVGRQSFHWTMDLHVPSQTLLVLGFIVPLACSLTAIWSGRSAMSSDAVRAVKEDW